MRGRPRSVAAHVLPVMIALVGCAIAAPAPAAEMPPVPDISGPIAGPGRTYSDPPINMIATAKKVEDFPYVTGEFFVSGTAAGAPYATRIVVRRPGDVNAFSAIVVAEAMHAGGRSLIFEWSRVSILTRKHLFVEIVHSRRLVARARRVRQREGRHPQRVVDVPVATYGVLAKGKTPAQDRLCLLAGTKIPLPDATIKNLYGGRAAYEQRVNQRLTELIRDGWYLPEYADIVRDDLAGNVPAALAGAGPRP